MSFRGSLFVLFPHLDCLVSFTSKQPCASDIIAKSINPSFTLLRARLCNCLGLLEVVAALPIPKPQATVVASCSHNSIFIDGHRVDNGLLLGEHVVQKLTPRKVEFFDGVCRSRCEAITPIYLRMMCHCPYRFLMMR
ncbi:hypothetical protein ACFX1Z_035927 [Malus domestica]